MPPLSVPNPFSGADVIQIFLKIEDPSAPVVQNKERLNHPSSHRSALITLNPLFSQITFRLIEMVSITQHGEFATRSKQGNFQTIVEMGGHVSHRHLLGEPELKEIQYLYQQILETQIERWRLSKVNS